MLVHLKKLTNMYSFQQVHNMHQSKFHLLPRDEVCHFAAALMHIACNLCSSLYKVAWGCMKISYIEQ